MLHGRYSWRVFFWDQQNGFHLAMRASDGAFFIRAKLIGVKFNPAFAMEAIAGDETRNRLFGRRIHLVFFMRIDWPTPPPAVKPR